MSKEEMECPHCGAKEWKSEKMSERRIVDGISHEVGGIPVVVCQGCGERFTNGQDFDRYSDQIARMVARGPAGPEAFKFLRQEMKWTSRKLAAVLKTTPASVSRWEAGKVKVPELPFEYLAFSVAQKIDSPLQLVDFIQEREERAEADKESSGPRMISFK